VLSLLAFTSSTKVPILACFTGAKVQILTAEARQALLGVPLLLPLALLLLWRRDRSWKSLV
jgi:hypothetical protein